MDERIQNLNRVVVILGPTATGKTDLALFLAKRYGGELISCDSRQVYKGLDIGTGKLPGKYRSLEKHLGYWVLDGIKIRLFDVAKPTAQFSVKDYIGQVKKAISKIEGNGRLPIIVGGTGLYLKALLKGMDSLSVPVDFKLRQQLNKKPLSRLQEILISKFPTRWQTLNQSDRSNKRRLVRAIELMSAGPSVNTGDSYSLKGWKVLKIGLTTRREILLRRIGARLRQRTNQGLIEEARQLYGQGLSLSRMRQLGLEYGVLADLLEGKLTRGEFFKRLETKIYQYAKRQMTWFKRETCVLWFDISKRDFLLEVESAFDVWYDT